jgi:nucleoside-diphosphate-sugar epimerase
VYRACGVLHGTEGGSLEHLPLTESSQLRTTLQTYSPEALRRVQQVFQWLDEEYDKIPVEREILGRPELPGTVMRLPMVYGPGDPLHRFKSILTRMAADPTTLIMEEKLAAWRSPRGYVENVARAIALGATKDNAAGRVYNVAELESFSELEWAGQIADAIGWRGRIETVPFDRAPAEARIPGNLDQHWIVDSTRIREELGYQESVDRREAIRRTIAWERASAPV